MRGVAHYCPAPAVRVRAHDTGEATHGWPSAGRVGTRNLRIGLETARVLALRGARVLGSTRSLARGPAAWDGFAGRLVPVELDLADFASVRACAARVRELAPRLDAVVCNAGIVLGEWQRVGGIEKHFVVNHLGHHLLVNQLLDRVVAARGRVVVLGSANHHDAPEGGIQFDQLSGEGWHQRAYSHSKLANGLFSLELSRAGGPGQVELRDAGIPHAHHPTR